MTTKHTPGPWEKVYDTACITRGIRGQHGPEIVNVVNWNGISRSTSVTGQANANLIAAAPDLLDELLSVLDWAVTERAPLREQEIESIRKVIDRATGEQP